MSLDVGNENEVGDDVEREVVNDTLKGTTFGDPDGPPRFVDSLGVWVPTYIDPRVDLVSHDHRSRALTRLDYHVPFAMRGHFKSEQWPKAFRDTINFDFVRVDDDGFVKCCLQETDTKAGGPCGARAFNRTLFCNQHGSALHPADKKLSVKSNAPMPEDRIARLDRVSKFMQGLLGVNELDDDEISGGFVRDSSGRPVKVTALGRKFEEIVTKELQQRLNMYLKSKAPKMLEVVTDIAESDLVEPADRLKAAIWAFERVAGRTPEVLIHGETEKPYMSILDSIESGSREDYRKSREANQITSARVLEIEGQVIDEDFQDSFGDGSSGPGISPGGFDGNSSVVDVEALDEDGFEGGTSGDGEPDLLHVFKKRGEKTRVSRAEDAGIETSTPVGSATSAGFFSDGVNQGELDQRAREPSSLLRGEGGSVRNEGIRGFGDAGDSSGTGTLGRVESAVASREELRKRAAELRKARNKAKQRRFAARAVGATTLEEVQFFIEWKIITSVHDKDFGKFRMKLWHPDEVNEKVLERIDASNDETRQAAALAAAAAKLGLG